MIECPACQTRYRIEVPGAGQKMRCARCGHVWQARPLSAAQDFAPEHTPAPERALSHEQHEQEGQAAPENQTGHRPQFAHDVPPAPETSPNTAQAPSPHVPYRETSGDGAGDAGHEGHGTITPGPEGFADEAQATATAAVAYSAAQTYRAYQQSDPLQGEAHGEAHGYAALSGTGPLETTVQDNAAAGQAARLQSGTHYSGTDYDETAGEAPQPPQHDQEAAFSGAAFAGDVDSEAPPLQFAQSEAARQAAAARMQGPQQGWVQKIRTNMAWAALAGAVTGVVLAAGIFRTQIVRALPGMAAVYQLVGLDVNVRGLSFKDVRYRWEGGEGSGILTIEGEIVNVTSEAVKVPPILAELSDSTGFVFYRTNKVVRYVALDSGERSFFSLTIKSPPRAKDLAEVRLHFRMDLL